MVHMPAGVAQKTGDHPVAVATVIAGQGDDVLGQLLLVGPAARNLALRGSVLTENPAGPTF